MLKVKLNEKRSEYVARCIPACLKEGLSQEQAKGKCESIYSSERRGGLAKAARGKE